MNEKKEKDRLPPILVWAVVVLLAAVGLKLALTPSQSTPLYAASAPVSTLVPSSTLVPTEVEIPKFGQVQVDYDYAEEFLIGLDTIESVEQVIIVPNVQPTAQSSSSGQVTIQIGEMKSFDELEIPVGSLASSSPCGVGQTMCRTGYNFGPRWTDGVFHPAFDGKCSASDEVYVVSDAVVWRLWDDRLLGTSGYDPSGPSWASGGGKYGGLGRAYVMLSRVPVSELPAEVGALTVSEYPTLILVYGHLAYPADSSQWPVGGDTVSQGQHLGSLTPTTGNSTGTHLHYGVGLVLDSGAIHWIDPTAYGGATPSWCS